MVRVIVASTVPVSAAAQFAGTVPVRIFMDGAVAVPVIAELVTVRFFSTAIIMSICALRSLVEYCRATFYATLINGPNTLTCPEA